MFWSGNFIAVRELKFLLKQEDVTLTQVLEADDILQECKADNKALIQFLTRPDILAELITHVTEEPHKDVELAVQYRHANIASEVIASNISTLRDRLSIDAVQMGRLCDFVNTDETLNPLLSSFYSKTIEILLQRNPKQDGYLHHIVSLRVLDFFKSRRDFLPNLLRHISTSAICDIFKIFLSLMDPFNKIIIEWFDDHQFLESMIQIICGTYGDPPPEPASITAAPVPAPSVPAISEPVPSTSSAFYATESTEKADKESANSEEKQREDKHREEKEAAERADRDRRWRRRFAADNAARLLCDVAADACCGDGAACGCGARVLQARLRGEDSVRRLLQAVFTAPPASRRHALEHACDLLLALLATEPAAGAAELERAVAPHLPLLHRALLRADPPDPADYDLPVLSKGVGNERLAVAALLARLACSEVDDVPNALVTLGTPGVLLDMFFEYPNNNFLHKNVRMLIRNARANNRFGDRYTEYLMGECNLLSRFMDAFEMNENLTPRQSRAGYMGHLIEALRDLDQRPPPLDHNTQFRWDVFREMRLRIVLAEHDTPLGGVYPSENTYEMTDAVGESIPAGYDFLAASEAANDAEAAAEVAASMHLLTESREHMIKVGEPSFDVHMWDDAPEDEHAARPDSWPWEAGVVEHAEGDDESWAQFDAFGQSDAFGQNEAFGQGDAFGQSDPFTNTDSFWPSSGGDDTSDMDNLQHTMQQCNFQEDKQALTIILASKMLNAFLNMPTDQSVIGETGEAVSGQTSAAAGGEQAAGSSSGLQASAASSETEAADTASSTQDAASETQSAGETCSTVTVSETKSTGPAGDTQSPAACDATTSGAQVTATAGSSTPSDQVTARAASDTQDTRSAGHSPDSNEAEKEDTSTDNSQTDIAYEAFITSVFDDGASATEDTSTADS